MPNLNPHLPLPPLVSPYDLIYSDHFVIHEPPFYPVDDTIVFTGPRPIGSTLRPFALLSFSAKGLFITPRLNAIISLKILNGVIVAEDQNGPIQFVNGEKSYDPPMTGKLVIRVQGEGFAQILVTGKPPKIGAVDPNAEGHPTVSGSLGEVVVDD